MFENKETTKLSSYGEFGLIDLLTKNIKIKRTSTLKGIGDDAAVLDLTRGKTVVTTDLLVEGVHFDMMFTPLKHLGYKSIVVNLSDVYAMNATPSQVTVSIAVSSRYTVDALEELYAGMLLACKNYHVDLVGGDTTSSASGLVISVTAIGTANQKDLVYRNGAQNRDLLCVSGDLGGAYLGLQVLEREKAVFKENPEIQPDLSGYDYVVERQLKPEARKDVIEMLKELHIKPTSMIDISDGLASEVIHLCKQSKVGCKLFEDRIPIDHNTHKACEEFNLNPSTAALNGGEDYELLFTIQPKDYDKIKGHTEIYPIGHITDVEGKYDLIPTNGESVQLTAQGWNAFGGAE